MRDQRVLTFAVEHPWALTRPMVTIVATVLARHFARVEPDGVPLRRRGPVAVTDLTAQNDFVLRDAPPPPAPGGVMVIPIHGCITPHADDFTDVSGLATYDDVTAAIAKGIADPKVSALVLDIDSPGGTVAGATECAAQILAARERKPIYAHANFEMCSAAYWLGACATELVASPSSVLGSIGVYCVHEDLSKAFEDLGIKFTYISAGKFKVDGNEAEPLSETARKRFQFVVDYYYDLFTTDIAVGRRVSVDAIRTGYGQGAVLTATEALAVGMVDRIETFDQTVARALTLPVQPSTAAHRAATLTAFERDLVALSF